MAKIIVDYREDKNIVKELYKHNIDVEIKSLISADFVMQIKDVDGHVKDLAIERKTGNDFLNSIIDKRILTQLIALKENFPLQLLICITKSAAIKLFTSTSILFLCNSFKIFLSSL